VAQFTIRNLEDDIHQKLRDMAQSHGQNLEEYVRELLRKVALERVATPSNLGTKIAKRFVKIGLKERIEELRGRPMLPPSVSVFEISFGLNSLPGIPCFGLRSSCCNSRW
jgi:plasmid stability protein